MCRESLELASDDYSMKGRCANRRAPPAARCFRCKSIVYSSSSLSTSHRKVCLQSSVCTSRGYEVASVLCAGVVVVCNYASLVIDEGTSPLTTFVTFCWKHAMLAAAGEWVEAEAQSVRAVNDVGASL